MSQAGRRLGSGMEISQSGKDMGNKDESGMGVRICAADDPRILDSVWESGQIHRTSGHSMTLTKNIPSPRSLLIGSVLTAILLIFIYTYPRLIISWLGKDNPWTSYLYLYGFGAGFFMMGIYIILRSGSCQLDRGYDKLWFWVLLLGFFFFAGIHALWIVASVTIPYLGT